MTLYVKHVLGGLVGSPLQQFPDKLPQVNGIRATSLDEYLSEMDGNARVAIADRIENALSIFWRGNKIRKHDAIRDHIKRIVTPFILAGRIPNDLNYPDLKRDVGISSREELEYALFFLIKDINIEMFKRSRKP